jgi:hypothetical protein
MEIMETIWPISAAVIAVLITWGGVVVSISQPDYRLARGLFYVSACILGATYFIWELTTDKPGWFRASAGVLTTIAICVVLPMVLAWTRGQENAG